MSRTACSDIRKAQKETHMKKNKGRGRKVLIIVLAVLAASGIGIFAMMRMVMKSIGAGSGSVADADKRVIIWEMPAGSSSRSKLDDMNIRSENGNLMLATVDFAKAIVNADYEDAEQTIDTFTYLYEIKTGYEKETYDDQPYLIPYPAEQSKGAVIVIPGGGFGYKSMDGTTGEGKDIAEELNKAGYTAFVLHYRSNPYEYPIPYLDVQRAVRFIRYHASDYGFNPDCIGLIGFSAGGNEIGGFINLVMGKDLFPEDYVPDEIDAVDDSVRAPAMIYPALSFNNNVPMLFCMFDDEQVRDDAKRQELLNLMDLKLHLNTDMKNQFVSYGTADNMVGMDESKAYIKAARDAGIDVVEVAAEGKNHGYTFENYGAEYLQWLDAVFSE